MTLTFGSLFSGIGGFDLGFERAGMTCAWQVEIDDKCRDVLTRHWPDVPKYEDVKNVGRHNLEPVDVICGGFPCQDLSVAGQRAGLAGERSGLWFEFHRILAELKPRWVVIENVPGLLSSNKGRDFAVLLRGLVELRYGVCWRVLDAQYFGVPQRRRRVFIVGSLGNGRSAQVLFERTSRVWNPPPSREKGQGFARDVAPCLAASGRGTERTGESRGRDAVVAAPIAKSYAKHHGASGGNDSYPHNAIICPIRRVDRKDKGLGRDVERVGTHLPVSGAGATSEERRLGTGVPDVAGTLAAGAHPGSYNGRDAERGMLVVAPLGARKHGQRHDLDNDTYVFQPRYARNGRGAPDTIAAPLTAEAGRTGKGDSAQCVAYGVSENQRAEVRLTPYSRQITSGGGKPGQGYPCVAGSSGVRRLTPAECRRLQDFPDDWNDGQSDSAAYRQLGNTVCVAVIEWIGLRIATMEAQ